MTRPALTTTDVRALSTSLAALSVAITNPETADAARHLLRVVEAAIPAEADIYFELDMIDPPDAPDPEEPPPAAAPPDPPEGVPADAPEDDTPPEGEEIDLLAPPSPPPAPPARRAWGVR